MAAAFAASALICLSVKATPLPRETRTILPAVFAKSDFSPPYFTVSSGSVGSPMNTKSYSVPLLSSDLSSVVKAALLQVAPPVNVLPAPSA